MFFINNFKYKLCILKCNARIRNIDKFLKISNQAYKVIQKKNEEIIKY